MAGSLFKLFVGDVKCLQIPLVRYGHRLRGKPPGIARSLQQRLEELNYKDPSVHFKVDIGFPKPKPSRSVELKERLNVIRARRSDTEIEKLSRLKKLEIPLSEVKEEWLKTAGPFEIKRVAEHYGIFNDLFGDAYFVPRVMLNVKYKISDDSYLPVQRGNVIKPAEAATVPEVTYTSDPNSLWTIILTNPDGHLTKQDSEYVHWFVGNIPGSDISKGEVVWNYLQPFPPRGTGYHRLVFILYKQDKKMDYSKLKKEGPCLKLEDRTFLTLEFYRERQDYITPAGLAFFQCDWDHTTTDFFHNTLDMEEPVFEYDFPPPYIRPQKWFPLKQPFNLYMDKYRDPKQVTKEYLMKKLKKVHPFRKPDPPPRFPNIFVMDQYRLPSWLRVEMKKDRVGWGRINDV
ncbi:large ribosomal subunit protein mL38 [Periplaneta americana]|uniref:large ribosomal subunit protein mL38 n=1 Tax=Periplaneta americana TaxID=6978 RepID=UPI0037E89246